MAITRTPIHDDDGSGTTGTILDNAWKQEFYNQIDAADAAGAASLAVLRKTSGTNSATGVATLDSVAISGLAITDELRITIALTQGSAAGAQLLLQTLADSTLLRLDDMGGGSLTAGGRGLWTISLRGDTAFPLLFLALATGGAGAVGASAPCGTRLSTISNTAANWLNSWTLGLLSTGQSASGTQTWSWTVEKI